MIALPYEQRTQRMYSGRMVDVRQFHCKDVSIVDIAHHLSQICSFNGGTLYHFSIAQHSLLVAELVWLDCRNVTRTRAALLHDASDAYCGDLIRPIKHGSGMVSFRNMEDDVQRIIEIELGLYAEASGWRKFIKRRDVQATAMAARCLFDPPYFPAESRDTVYEYDTHLLRVLRERPTHDVRHDFLQCFASPTKYFQTEYAAREQLSLLPVPSTDIAHDQNEAQR